MSKARVKQVEVAVHNVSGTKASPLTHTHTHTHTRTHTHTHTYIQREYYLGGLFRTFSGDRNVNLAMPKRDEAQGQREKM